MGDVTGFLKYKRQDETYRPADERIKDYNEVAQIDPVGDFKDQAARCMDCGIPFCHAIGCPVMNLIPEWNDAVYKGLYKEGFDRLEFTNNFPEFTGRICPAPCETSCTLSINDAPVTIRRIELGLIEEAYKKGWVKPQPPANETGQRVAVVGSGPAGLAAAQQLRRMGHRVTVFEKDQKPGGLLRYGIPDFKLEKSVIDRRLEVMKAEGIEFECGVNIGYDLSGEYLQRKFDAIVLTMGAGQPRDLPVPGRDLEGVHFAMDFLSRSNKWVSGETVKNDMVVKGEKVLVIGGGDTGSDCVGTSNRQGAESIHQFEIMPKPTDWKKAENPSWPDWPQILRTSSSHKEGCERDWSITTKEFFGKNGKLTGAKFAKVEWYKDQNDRWAFKEVPGSDFELELDRVFLAMGFVHVQQGPVQEALGVSYDERGNIPVDADYMTNVPGVFSAGDANTGASLVVRAINHGRQAAEGVNRYLKQKV